MKPKVWVSYAWKDNEDSQVDWIVQELEKQDLEIHLDNRYIVPGRKLWEQIASAIADPTVCDAWIFVVTPNSLASQPCQEELAYALNRALSARGSDFPLIGLIDGKFSSQSLPSALKVRLCVSTFEHEWRKRVAAGARGDRPGRASVGEIQPYLMTWHDVKGHEFMLGKDARYCLEISPRAGGWCPFVALVPVAEATKLLSVIPGARGQIPGAISVTHGKASMNGFEGISIGNEINPLTSAFISFKDKPTMLIFGDQHSKHKIPLQ